jgi:hypothetical protein
MEELDLGGDLSNSENPVRILDTVERVTHNKVIKMCKVQWSHHTEDEATCEHEEESEQITPSYSRALPESRGRDSLKGVGL